MKLDDEIANLECLLQLFKFVHPNTISIFGIICNFYIIKFLYYKNKHLANIVLIARYFADILDGAVARRFNKSSKIGGYLDTIDDVVLISFYSTYIAWSLSKNINLSLFIGFMCFSVTVYYLKCQNSLSDHSSLKNGNTSLINKLVEFLVNNTIFIYLGLYYLNNNVL